jgi:ribosomal protein L37AE/L43A
MGTTIARIRWAARLEPSLLRRLYELDARGIQDVELCDAVGSALFARCETFERVRRGEVVCPACGSVFAVARAGESHCPGSGCAWRTTHASYWKSVSDHYAFTGRAVAAFADFHARYPGARSYREKLVLIDQLIHGFHLSEQAAPVKSIASKLLQGNKKDVVRFLDELSARDPRAKDEWRRIVATTIDARLLKRETPS